MNLYKKYALFMLCAYLIYCSACMRGGLPREALVYGAQLTIVFQIAWFVLWKRHLKRMVLKNAVEN